MKRAHILYVSVIGLILVFILLAYEFDFEIYLQSSNPFCSTTLYNSNTETQSQFTNYYHCPMLYSENYNNKNTTSYICIHNMYDHSNGNNNSYSSTHKFSCNMYEESEACTNDVAKDTYLSILTSDSYKTYIPWWNETANSRAVPHMISNKLIRTYAAESIYTYHTQQITIVQNENFTCKPNSELSSESHATLIVPGDRGYYFYNDPFSLGHFVNNFLISFLALADTFNIKNVIIATRGVQAGFSRIQTLLGPDFNVRHSSQFDEDICVTNFILGIPDWFIGLHAPKWGHSDFVYVDYLINKYYPKPKFQSPKYLYAVRSGHNRRQIINETQFLEWTKEIIPEIEAFKMDTMNRDELVNLFSQCALFISSYGSGLSNLLFMPKHATVVSVLQHHPQSNSLRNMFFEPYAEAQQMKYVEFHGITLPDLNCDPTVWHDVGPCSEVLVSQKEWQGFLKMLSIPLRQIV